MRSRRLIILGSTGSIGVSTLEVVSHLRAIGQCDFDVMGLATGSRAERLCEQAKQFNVQHLAVASSDHHSCLAATKASVHQGPDAAMELVQSIASPGDLVVGAMVGSAGIPAILAAIDRGCDIALANKETLVAAGAIVMPAVKAKGVNLLPIDSEHSAIFQCLRQTAEKGSLDVSSVSKIILTASGGPFRTWSADRIVRATVAEALNHPTWNMGPKVTVDSASLMNKALEIIEAHWLFDLPSHKIDAVIHPQSVVHGMVEYDDGSVIAHLSPPDMKTPIQYALTWPQRCDGASNRMNWLEANTLEFHPIDHARFAAPALARRAIDAGGTSGAVLNAANEAAVQAFLEHKIPFGRIVEVVQEAFEAIGCSPLHTMNDMLTADAAARDFVQKSLSNQPETALR